MECQTNQYLLIALHLHLHLRFLLLLKLGSVIIFLIEKFSLLISLSNAMTAPLVGVESCLISTCQFQIKLFLAPMKLKQLIVVQIFINNPTTLCLVYNPPSVSYKKNLILCTNGAWTGTSHLTHLNVYISASDPRSKQLTTFNWFTTATTHRDLGILVSSDLSWEPRSLSVYHCKVLQITWVTQAQFLQPYLHKF